MARYKVCYSGFVYVEAEDETEALELAQDGMTIYEEMEWEDPEEIDDFAMFF